MPALAQLSRDFLSAALDVGSDGGQEHGHALLLWRLRLGANGLVALQLFE